MGERAIKRKEQMWLRKALRLHNQLVELAEDIERTEGETRRFSLVSDAHCTIGEFTMSIEETTHG